MSEFMIFCLGDGKYEKNGEGYQKNNRIFNKDVTHEEYNRVRQLLNENEIKIQLTKWVSYSELDSSEQTTATKQLDGMLKTFSYKDAWSEFWSNASKAQKDCILTLPQFDAAIFKEITGIDTSVEDDKMTEAMELLKKNGYKIVKD